MVKVLEDKAAVIDLTFEHLENFVNGNEDNIPDKIISILREKEAFVRDFVSTYPLWLSEDLGEIAEGKVEETLDIFRSMNLTAEPAVSVEAIQSIRDLFLSFSTIIQEKELAYADFSVESVLKLVIQKQSVPFPEKDFKNLSSIYNSILAIRPHVPIVHAPFLELIEQIENYMWIQETRINLSRKQTKADAITRLLLTVPKELYEEVISLLHKKVKYTPMDDSDLTSYLTANYNKKPFEGKEGELGRIRSLVTKPVDRTKFKLTRLYNTIINNNFNSSPYIIEKLHELGVEGTVLGRYLCENRGLKPTLEPKLPIARDADSVRTETSEGAPEEKSEEMAVEPIAEEKMEEEVIPQPTVQIQQSMNEEAENIDVVAKPVETSWQPAEPSQAPAPVEEFPMTNEIADREDVRVITLKEAEEMMKMKTKPASYVKPQEKFESLVKTMQLMLGTIQCSSRPSLLDVSRVLHKGNKYNIEIPNRSDMEKLEAKGKEFKTRIVSMSVDELVDNQGSMEEEYHTLGIDVPEYERIRDDIKRDLNISHEVAEAIINVQKLNLQDIYRIKNLDQSARYFKNTHSTLKLYDILIMAIISAWQKHDHEKDEVQIDYGTLKEISSVILANKNDKEVSINPQNASFIERFYQKVREYVTEKLKDLTLEEIQNKNMEKSYCKFVDLTGKFIDHKAKLQEKANLPIEGDFKQKLALRPSGNKSKLNKRIHYSSFNHKGVLVYSRPAFVNKITTELRKYYVHSWTFFLETFQPGFIYKERAFDYALGLEREIYELFRGSSPVTYEMEAELISGVLLKLKGLKYVPFMLKEHRFSNEAISQLKGMPLDEMKNVEQNLRKVTISQVTKKTGAKQSDTRVSGQVRGPGTEGQMETGPNPSKEAKEKPVRPTVFNTDIEVKPSQVHAPQMAVYSVFQGAVSVASEKQLHSLPSVSSGLTADRNEHLRRAGERAEQGARAREPVPEDLARPLRVHQVLREQHPQQPQEARRVLAPAR
jgi:hypothetical protein